MTDESAGTPRGWIFYDGSCPFCLKWVQRTQSILGPRGFSFAPLQTAWVRERLDLPEDHLLREMRVLLLPSGESFGGADAIVEIARHVWWARPLGALARIPGVRPALLWAYQRVAARRYCLSKCRTSQHNFRNPPDSTEVPEHEIEPLDLGRND